MIKSNNLTAGNYAAVYVYKPFPAFCWKTYCRCPIHDLWNTIKYSIKKLITIRQQNPYLKRGGKWKMSLKYKSHWERRNKGFFSGEMSENLSVIRDPANGCLILVGYFSSQTGSTRGGGLKRFKKSRIPQLFRPQANVTVKKWRIVCSKRETVILQQRKRNWDVGVRK